MATDRQKYDLLYPQSKKTYEKVRAIISCPRCKEDCWAYITKKGRKRGITIKLQQSIKTLMDHDADCIEEFEDMRIYQCNVCGFQWKVKKVIKN